MVKPTPRALRHVFNFAAGPILAIVGPFLPWSVMAQDIVQIREHSFTNSPFLIAPKVFRHKGDLILVADARFMNDCLATAGLDASFVDLQKMKERVFFFRQRVSQAGCPDMYSPTIRAIEVFAKQANKIKKIHLLDHVTLGKSSDVVAPPVSLQVSDQIQKHNVAFHHLRVEAYPASNVRLGIPTLSTVQMVDVSDVSDRQTIFYTVEFTLPTPTGYIAEDIFMVRRYETRIGADEKSPVIDWIVILWKQNLPDIGTLGTKEKSTLSVTLEAAAAPPRQLGIVNPISSHAYKSEGPPFAFFRIN